MRARKAPSCPALPSSPPEPHRQQVVWTEHAAVGSPVVNGGRSAPAATSWRSICTPNTTSRRWHEDGPRRATAPHRLHAKRDLATLHRQVRSGIRRWLSARRQLVVPTVL